MQIAGISTSITRVVLGLTALLIVTVLHTLAMDHPSGLLESLGHSLHGPGFAGLTLVFFLLIGPTRKPRSRYYIAAGIGTAGALIAEAAQIPGARDAQFVDLLVDLAGIAGMLLLLAALAKQADTGWPKTLALPLGVGLLLLVSIQSIGISHALVRQHLLHPQIITFDSGWERRLIAEDDRQTAKFVDAPANWTEANRNIYRADEQTRWGIFLKLDPFPNWSDYTALSFVAASADGAPLEIAINIWDLTGAEDLGRENATVLVTSEPRRYRVSFETLNIVNGYRALDRRRIESLVFSAATPGRNRTLLIDDIRLER